MSDRGTASWFMAQETRALLTRLARVQSFALHETMVPAAALSPAAQIGIERFLAQGRRELQEMAHGYLEWLDSGAGSRTPPAELQRRFTFLRLRFQAVLSQFDTFSDVVTQRSEHETGVWLSGLDVAAADALALPGYYTAPPVICYLDRGLGAAIRRARTRLPGGGENPVAIIRVPRERMVGNGIASSLVHEVGHQGAALLDLMGSIRPILKGLQQSDAKQQIVWRLWERWISEIVADFWSVAKVGVAGHAGTDGRREPAPSLCVPREPRRSASHTVDSREAELRDGQRAVSASAVESPGRDVGIVLSDPRVRCGTPAVCWRCSRKASRVSSPCWRITGPDRCGADR